MIFIDENNRLGPPITSNSSTSEVCLRAADCVGLILTPNSPTSRLLDYIDMDSFLPKLDTVTLVRANPEAPSGIVGTSSWDLDQLDLCCPPNYDLDKESRHVEDSLERVPCDLDPVEFDRRFVNRQEPVVLVNCSSSWPAAQTWKTKDLLKLGDGQLRWRTDFLERRAGGLLTTWGSKTFLPGWKVAEILAKNGTARVFHSLGRRSSNPAGAGLFQDYKTPEPLPQDLYRGAEMATDYQWLILSQAGTGTALHMDPAYTIAWNSLISGRKWWALLPKHLPAEPFLCSPSCSATQEGDISQAAWFHHVLPQLRHLTWYGQAVREVNLGPGETLYLPSGFPHAVFNLEDNVSVTENYLASEGVTEVLAAILAGDDAGLGLSRGEERLWRSLYHGQLDAKGRQTAREVVNRLQLELDLRPELCRQ